jgi:hypothetical protein
MPVDLLLQSYVVMQYESSTYINAETLIALRTAAELPSLNRKLTLSFFSIFLETDPFLLLCGTDAVIGRPKKSVGGLTNT